MKHPTVMNTKKNMAFILDIYNYYANGSVCLQNLISDMKIHAKPVKSIKFIDLIDAGNCVYAYLHDNNILYIGKCSSRSFCERFAGHISKRPQSYMNNVMKKIAWLHSQHNNLSQDTFLADSNEPDRTISFIKAEKIMKNLRFVCLSFASSTSANKKNDICQFEKYLIKYLNPPLNGSKRNALSHINLKKLCQSLNPPLP